MGPYSQPLAAISFPLRRPSSPSEFRIDEFILCIMHAISIVAFLSDNVRIILGWAQGWCSAEEERGSTALGEDLCKRSTVGWVNESIHVAWWNVCYLFTINTLWPTSAGSAWAVRKSGRMKYLCTGYKHYTHMNIYVYFVHIFSIHR